DFAFQNIGAMHAHRTDLDDAILADVEPGGFGIEDDGVEGDQRSARTGCRLTGSSWRQAIASIPSVVPTIVPARPAQTGCSRHQSPPELSLRQVDLRRNRDGGRINEGLCRRSFLRLSL